MTTKTKPDPVLPPLPVAWGSAINDSGDGHIDLYSADQMRAYALAVQAQAESADQMQALREALHAAAEYIGDRSAGSSTFWDLYDAVLAKGDER